MVENDEKSIKMYGKMKEQLWKMKENERKWRKTYFNGVFKSFWMFQYL